MHDRYGRNIDYIRISVTDRCNLRCVYCMPEEGVPAVFHDEILSCEEIRGLAEIFGELGIRKIKVTGGEPLMRRNLAGLIRMLKEIPAIGQVTLTTNGVLLKEQMGELAAAGIDGINISLDTLDPEAGFRLTRRRELGRALEGFREALRYPEIPLKVNCVLTDLPGQNIQEVAELAKKHPIHVRFIEMMPLGPGRQSAPVSEEQVLRALAVRYGRAEKTAEHPGNGPAHYYAFPGFQGKIGFISAVSHRFCRECNRVRLTAEGFLKTCLQYDTGTDLKALLRSGAGREAVREAAREAIRNKPAGHRFGETSVEHREEKNMSQIGG